MNSNNLVKISPVFKGMCREIFFTIQNSKYIDGTLPKYENVETLSDGAIISTPTLKTSNSKNLLLYGEDNNGSGTPLDSYQIVFNGKIRETYRSGIYSNTIPFYAYHTNYPGDGINNYSMALYPELLQPSGHGTLNKIRRVDFDIKIKESVKKELEEYNRNLTIKFYTHGQTILRIMSGLSGLAFYV